MISYCRNIIFLILVVSLTETYKSHAQSYGMAFNSYETDLDKRTSLDLSPAEPLRLANNFTIGFDMSLFPYQHVYFGYIFRLVGENGKNIDLIFDNNRFEIVCGDKLSAIIIPVGLDKFFTKWMHLDLAFTLTRHTLTVTYDHKQYSDNAIAMGDNETYRLFFGANVYNRFSTKDVPPMQVRDIKITSQNVPAYSWPLNEYTGSVVHELIGQKDGRVANPVWVKAMHQQWKKMRSLAVNSVVSTAFNAITETISIITNDSVVNISQNPALNTSYGFKRGKVNFLSANQSFYANGNLYNFNIGQQTVLRFDFKKHAWNKTYNNSLLINYWHANKFYSPVDSALYVIGGYGQLTYKNSVQRYAFKDDKWTFIDSGGDKLTPRYLAALGTTAKGDTAYILGGFGNESGRQILNPGNIYDLVRFDVRTRTFKKMFDLKQEIKDFTFANSLVIDEKSRSYYGLVFDSHKFNSELRLVKGSLDKPAYRILASPIPYKFQDIDSFSDLYYCPQSKKFFAVAFFSGTSETEVNIYSLLAPPEVIGAGLSKKAPNRAMLFVLVGCLSIALMYFIFRRFKGKAFAWVNSNTVSIDQQPILETANAYPVSPCVKQGCIYLFGGLQFISRKEIDISIHFTPLLKEVFLFIFLHTLRWKTGVTTDSLNEVFWPGKSKADAKNNRAVNFAKLKSILEMINYVDLAKESGNWKITFDHSQAQVDYNDYLILVSSKNELTREKIIQLTEITRRGNFLPNVEYEWMDAFKSEISFEVVDIYIAYIKSIRLADDPELILTLTNHIFYFDPVHTEALELKCRVLDYLGNHLLAISTLASFKKEYYRIYDEEYTGELMPKN